MELKKMTVAQWAQVTNNPRQRDTVEHAKKAVKTHLKLASPTHAAVSAARLPGGDLVKLDGHTRSLLWSDGRLECPKVIECTIYAVSSMDEAKELYGNFDSPTAVETSRDKLAGAFREMGIHPTSGLILFGGVTSAINKLFPAKTPVYKMIKPWKQEIEALDSFGFTKTLSSGFILGALVLLRVHGVRVTEFLANVATDNGVKTPDGRDGVESFLAFAKDKKGRMTGEAAVTMIAGALITCADGFMKKRVFKRNPSIAIVHHYLLSQGKP